MIRITWELKIKALILFVIMIFTAILLLAHLAIKTGYEVIYLSNDKLDEIEYEINWRKF